jgi:hypothetical protein
MTEAKNVEQLGAVDLREILARLASVEKENAILKAVQEKSNSHDDDDEIFTRKSATRMRIRTIDGKPIVDMKLVPDIQLSNDGTAVVKSYMAHCTISGSDKIHKIPYMNGTQSSYENQKVMEYQLTDCVASDESGASSVDYNVVVSKHGKVAEIDRSGGDARATGREVTLVETRDFRKYTLLVDGEKVIIDQDHIYS